MSFYPIHRGSATVFVVLFLLLSLQRDLWSQEDNASAPPQGTASQVIYLNMIGGLPAERSFLPKNGEVASQMPLLAQTLNNSVILKNVRSPHTHVERERQYQRLTGYNRRETIQHPDIGSWVCRRHHGLRFHFKINSPAYTSMGFFPSHSYAPLRLTEPADALDISADIDLWKLRFEVNERLSDRSTDDTSAFLRYLSKAGNPRLLQWDEEPLNVRARYGDHKFGQSCLLARRLVASGEVAFIEIGLSGWEAGEEDSIAKLIRELDQGYSALVEDLQKRNLLDSTLIVIATDLSTSFLENYTFFLPNTPALLVGAGLQGGRIFSDNVSCREFNAMIACAVGVDPFQIEYSPNRRPFSVGDIREENATLFKIFQD